MNGNPCMNAPQEPAEPGLEEKSVIIVKNIPPSSTAEECVYVERRKSALWPEHSTADSPLEDPAPQQQEDGSKPSKACHLHHFVSNKQIRHIFQLRNLRFMEREESKLLKQSTIPYQLLTHKQYKRPLLPVQKNPRDPRTRPPAPFLSMSCTVPGRPLGHTCSNARDC